MNKSFYNGPKIEIRTDYIKIKKRNIILRYQDIKLIKIKNTRLTRVWFLYIIAGTIAFLIILYFFFLFIRGLINDSTILSGNGLYYRKHLISLFMFFFIGGPLFILIKVKKYFKNYPMLIIIWGNKDFRIKISDLGINVFKLKQFFEGKTESLEFDIQIQRELPFQGRGNSGKSS
jgi:hypothetical protein